MLSAKPSLLRRVQVLPISLAEAWAFFSNPRNLADITPEGMGFRILSDPPASLYPGLMLSYSVSPVPGLSTHWVTEITHVEAPHYFVDEQRMGPYRLWHHEHRFRSVPGGIEVEDLVHYVLPFGALGKALAGRWVRRRLEGIFRFRAEVLRKRFGAA